MSFCNVRTRGPSLAVLDLTAARTQPRWLELVDNARVKGARGMCGWQDLVCVAHQPGGRHGPPPGFVLLDPRRDFARAGGSILPSTPHSVCCRERELFFTMSREDSVYRAVCRSGLDDWEVVRHWTLPGSSGTADDNHVNAIELIDGSLHVSATGAKEPESELWSSAKRGFVYDIDDGRLVLGDLRQPHSLLADGNTVWTCETRGSRIISTGGEEHRLPGGHSARIRGLAIGEDCLYVGVSKDRQGSVSGGTLRGYRGSCCIYRLSRGSGRQELLIDLSDRRDEIYELMLV